MKRKNIVKIHLIATVLATISISSFFISSFIVEIYGNENIILQVKKVIFYSLPLLIIAMSALGISGNKLSGKSTSPVVLKKKKRMKFIFINGIILISLACYLYYRAHYVAVDSTFVIFQFIEFAFGLANLSLIGLNIKNGLLLSRKLKKRKKPLLVRED